MSIRSVLAPAATAALLAAAAGPAAAQSSYANPYGYAYPQQPYYAQPAVGQAAYTRGGYPQQGYPQQGYGQPYAPSPDVAQGYGAATYVQPYYGSPYAPPAGDPFPEQPAYRQPEIETVVVSGGSQPAAQPAMRQVAPRQPAPPQPAAAQPAMQPAAVRQAAPGAPVHTPLIQQPAAGNAQAPAGTFDQLHAARYSDPEATAGDWRPDPHEGYDGWLSELRFGILEHDAGVWSGKKEDGLDINGEVLFVSPDFLDVIFSPRPTIGGSIHTEGETNVVYFGLTWQWNIMPWLYLEGQWGPAFHDGNLTGQTGDKKGYGCPVLSRGSLALGLRYGHHSIQGFYSHMSNGDLCEENDGIDAAGVRYGYRF